MSMNKRYTGGFISIEGVHYTFDIFQEGYTRSVSDIAVTSDPLRIEWSEVDKLEPVQSSAATLELYSDSDRQFVDLYTVKAGSIRLDVYREGSLYWSGTLDPELYEEPFSYKTDYGVKLTFSDFAILDRLNWTDKGFKTMREVINLALSAMGIHYSGLTEHISTLTSEYSSADILDQISIQGQNFFDEDDKSMTLREVLDETLRPFALRLIQKNGTLHLYDLNSVYTAFNESLIKWNSDDAVLSVDKTFNNVKVKFSPYEKTQLMKASVDPGTVGNERELTIYINYKNATADEKGFTISLSDSGKGLAKSASAKFFKITPVYSGNEEAGIAWSVKTLTTRNGTIWNQYLNAPTSNLGGQMFRVPDKPYLSYIGLDRRNFKLKLSLDVLFDTRYNPFEEAGKANEGDQYDHLQDWANFAYVPIKLTLRDEAGVAISHFDNHLVKDGNSFAHPASQHGWKSGEAAWGDAWLCWYKGNRKNESGLGGWQKNKQIIGYYRENLPASFDKMGDGEFIDLPDRDGCLELEVGVGFPAYDYNKEIKQKLYDPDCKFILYKNPSIDLVDKYGKNIKKKDIQLKAWINPDAQEDLNITTYLGTMQKPTPAALGLLFNRSENSVQKTFYRAGVTTQLENLLIATVYSNYAGRNLVLSGEAELLPTFSTYTDTAEPGKYLIIEEKQDLLLDKSDIKMVQFSADSFEGVEIS